MAITRDNADQADFVLETNQVGNNHIQRVCLDLGTAGVADPVEGTVPITVVGTPTVEIIDGDNVITVDGTVSLGEGTAQLGSVTAYGAGTFASNATVNNWPQSYPIEDGGRSITVDGTVTANAGTGTFTVLGTQYISNQLDISGLGTYAAQVTTNELLSALGSGTYSANVTVLNSVSGTFSGTVTAAINNLPSCYPIPAYALLYDEGATYTYIGHADPGSSAASAVWRIKRLTNADCTIVYADGDADFDNVWNDRSTLSYS